jgi:hypothetical protein
MNSRKLSGLGLLSHTSFRYNAISLRTQKLRWLSIAESNPSEQHPDSRMTGSGRLPPFRR